MGKNHFQKYHATEGRIKRCLRFIITNKSEIIQSQTEIIESQIDKIEKLEYSLDKSNCKIDYLLDKVECITNDLKIALERKEYYKDMYIRHRE